MELIRIYYILSYTWPGAIIIRTIDTHKVVSLEVVVPRNEAIVRQFQIAARGVHGVRGFPAFLGISSSYCTAKMLSIYERLTEAKSWTYYEVSGLL